LCSRLRRGILYRTATELKATKIALGHHRDDMLETMFLNMFYGGRLKSMPPRLVSDNKEHVVIRPMAYCNEADIQTYAEALNFPIIPCNLCGSQENLQRQNIKAMLEDWHRRFPGRVESMFKAMQNIVPSHMLDRSLFDFSSNCVESNYEGEGDIGFDAPLLSTDGVTKPALPNNDIISIIELK
jgi:tRNA 2-thiocytidine biosynthesis protein TtcA